MRQGGFSKGTADGLAGAVVGRTLIPEAIVFSIIAGVVPKMGLYASFIIAVMTGFRGKTWHNFERHWCDGTVDNRPI
ncbi:SulP family inorganic anion transporter [Lyngbya sp. CCY1209]|uniref:SulP family inorganic anion transporter n=1 Tax=Lyngbya sp. CCY1209 TaxID=2886103 RepID=UPI002D76C520|nr:SulP family inorganic anion transporter [Lyngbya sp. CCY1209]